MSEFKSIRLNQGIRAEIASNIEQAWIIKNPKPEMVEPMTTLLDAIKARFLAESAELVAKVASVGVTENQLRTVCRLGTQIDGQTKYTDLQDEHGAYTHVADPSPTRGIYVLLDNETTKDDPLYAEYVTYREALKEARANRKELSTWEKEKGEYMADVRNVLTGVNTTGQLLSVWEECEKFIPAGLLNPSKINLPSVNISRLNKQI